MVCKEKYYFLWCYIVVVKQFEMKTLKEILTGLPKEVVEYLESNTKLAKIAIESHKKDFSNNVKYIIIGFLFSLVPQGLSLLYKQSDLKQLKEQFDEILSADEMLWSEEVQMPYQSYWLRRFIEIWNRVEDIESQRYWKKRAKN